MSSRPILAEIAPEQLRRYIAQQACPWCERGAFKVLANHTFGAHGVSAAELRELAGLFKSSTICDPDHAKACGDRAASRNPTLPPNASRLPRQLSAAAKELNRRKIRENDARIGPEAAREQRLQAGRIRGEQARRPHPCSVCGTTVLTATLKTCSPRCRRVIRRRTGYLVATRPPDRDD